MTIKTDLPLLHNNTITFAEFYKRTLNEWEALAGSLIKRWPTTAALDVEDLMQVMLAAVPDLVARWDGRSSLPDFVIWNTCSKATRVIHNDRNALRRQGDAPSRNAVTFSEISPRGDVSGGADVADLLPALQQPPAQPMVENVLDAMKLVRGRRERVIMEALTRTQSYDGAAAQLVESEGMTPRWARLSVVRGARKFADRMAAVG